MKCNGKQKKTHRLRRASGRASGRLRRIERVQDGRSNFLRATDSPPRRNAGRNLHKSFQIGAGKPFARGRAGELRGSVNKQKNSEQTKEEEQTKKWSTK